LQIRLSIAGEKLPPGRPTCLYRSCWVYGFRHGSSENFRAGLAQIAGCRRTLTVRFDRTAQVEFSSLIGDAPDGLRGTRRKTPSGAVLINWEDKSAVSDSQRRRPGLLFLCARCFTCLKALRTSSLFFVFPLRKIALPDTLPTAEAEDKALPGGNLSADFGARPSWGSRTRAPAIKSELGWHESVKSQGPWGRSPQKKLPSSQQSFRPFRSFPSPLFRRTHVSAFNLCMSLFRESGVSIIIQPRWASETAELTRASTKEPAASAEARDKPPAWSTPTKLPQPSGEPQPQPPFDDSWRV